MEFKEEKLFWYLAMLWSLTAQSKDSPLGCRSRASTTLPVPAQQKGPVLVSASEPGPLHQCCRQKTALPDSHGWQQRFSSCSQDPAIAFERQHKFWQTLGEPWPLQAMAQVFLI